MNNQQTNIATPHQAISTEAYQIIPFGKYLSDCPLEKIEKNTMLISPTGSGKSNFAANIDTKTIMVTVNTSLVEQMKSLYGFTAFYEQEKVISDKIVVTYASFPLLCEAIDLEQENYTVIIDEVHNFTASASKSYMWKHLNDTMNALEDLDCVKICLTATPLYNFHPFFNSLETITFKGEFKHTLECQIALYGDKKAAIKSLVSENIASGKLTVIYLLNKNESGQLGSIKEALKDLVTEQEIMTINGDKRDTEDYTQVVKFGEIKSTIKVVFVTSIIKEGISVTKHNENVEFVFLGYIDPFEVAQVAARCRNAKSVKCWILQKNTLEENKEATKFNFDYYFTTFLDEAKDELLRSNLDLKAAVRNNESAHFKKCSSIANILSSKDYVYYCEKSKMMKLDYLGLSYTLQNDYKNHLNKQENSLEMLEVIAKYGFKTITTPKIIENILSEEENEAITLKTSLLKEEKDKNTQTIIESLKTLTIEEFDAKLDKATKGSLEKDILLKVKTLTKYCVSLEAATNLLNEIGLTTSAWNQFKKVESVQIVRNNIPAKTKSKNRVSEYFNEIYSNFLVGNRYSKAEIQRMINELQMSIFKTKGDLTSNATTKQINVFFDCKDYNTKEGEKGFELLSTNPYGIDTKFWIEDKKVVEQQRNTLATWISDKA